jgi:hypothetical protein
MNPNPNPESPLAIPETSIAESQTTPDGDPGLDSDSRIRDSADSGSAIRDNQG